MRTVLSLLRQDRKVEAVKAFRDAYKTDLRQAIDAVEAIREVYFPTDFIVVSRYDELADYQVCEVKSMQEAMNEANRFCHTREDVVVANVIARSIVVRAMQEISGITPCRTLERYSSATEAALLLAREDDDAFAALAPEA